MNSKRELSAEEKQVVETLAKSAVSEVADYELDMFDELAEAFYEDLASPPKKQKKKQPSGALRLGLGGGAPNITLIAMDASLRLLEFMIVVTGGTLTSVVSAYILGRQKTTNDDNATAGISFTVEQAKEARRIVMEEASKSELPQDEVEALANAILARVLDE